MILYNPIYTINEICDLLHVSESILWTYIKRGRLRYVIIENTCFIRGIDIEKFINNLTAL